MSALCQKRTFAQSSRETSSAGTGISKPPPIASRGPGKRFGTVPFTFVSESACRALRLPKPIPQFGQSTVQIGLNLTPLEGGDVNPRGAALHVGQRVIKEGIALGFGASSVSLSE